MKAKDLVKDLVAIADPDIAKSSARFFKTGKGEYAHGDQFLGIRMGDIRNLAKKYTSLHLNDVKKLLSTKYHEVRMAGALVLTYKYPLENEEGKRTIYYFYLENAKKFNNWDLVDVSAHNIIGNYLLDKPRDVLYELIIDQDKWLRRIAMVSTLTLIRNNDLDDVYKLSQILMKDNFDLSHKATGWMLREAGKKDEKRLKKFLKEHVGWMPRTTLRYAIERFEEKERKKFLKM